MSCFGNCIPTPDEYAKDIVAKMKKTASEGGDILSLLVRPGASVLYVLAPRTGLLRAVRTGGTGQPRTVRTPYAYQPRMCRTYHVPWQPR